METLHDVTYFADTVRPAGIALGLKGVRGAGGPGPGGAEGVWAPFAYPQRSPAAGGEVPGLEERARRRRAANPDPEQGQNQMPTRNRHGRQPPGTSTRFPHRAPRAPSITIPGHVLAPPAAIGPPAVRSPPFSLPVIGGDPARPASLRVLVLPPAAGLGGLRF